MRVKRKLGLVVTGVRHAGAPGHYYISAMIDGVERSFAIAVVDEELGAIKPLDEAYEEYVHPYLDSSFVPEIIMRVHRGEKLEFPIDLRPATEEFLRRKHEALSKPSDDE